MDATGTPAKTQTDRVNMKVLLYLIEHNPLLAIEFANEIPAYMSLVVAVANYAPRFAADMPTESFLQELIEDAKQWLAEP